MEIKKGTKLNVHLFNKDVEVVIDDIDIIDGETILKIKLPDGRYIRKNQKKLIK